VTALPCADKEEIFRHPSLEYSLGPDGKMRGRCCICGHEFPDSQAAIKAERERAKEAKP
jgi:hypothetical protein